MRSWHDYFFYSDSNVKKTSRNRLKLSLAPIFIPAFRLGRVAGVAALGGLEILHGFQQSLIVPQGSHQDGTKQRRRCNHVTWSLVDLWAAFPWM